LELFWTNIGIHISLWPFFFISTAAVSVSKQQRSNKTFIIDTITIITVFFLYALVLGLARTGSTFTKSQEGTQPGQLTQTGQRDRVFNTMCWVSDGGAGQGGKLIVAREHVGHWAVRVTLCISLFVLYILLMSIIVITVHFVHCSVKLPLSLPTSFCLFLSILLPNPAGEG